VVEPTPEHLEALEEIERHGLSGLAEVLRQEGLDAVRYVLWDATGWHEDYAVALAQEGKTTKEQQRKGWEMFVFIEKVLVTVLHEVLKQQAEETMVALSEGPEGFYG
jgi:hypothetical protein